MDIYKSVLSLEMEETQTREQEEMWSQLAITSDG